MLWSDPEICLFDDQGKIIVGKVTYNLEWQKDYTKDPDNTEIVSITFNEDETPVWITESSLERYNWYNSSKNSVENFKNEMKNGGICK